MPSSTSSSEPVETVRLTASDRPGVAQPVPQRDIPPQPWPRLLILAAVLTALLLTAWELAWRAYGAVPATRNSDGLWAQQRRRIDEGEGSRTVVIGSSRLLFDLDLDTWQRLSNERPIQLALEGTSAVYTLEDLAEDPNFKGRLIIGVAPELFFSGFGYRRGAIKRYHHESPSQRLGQWLSMRLIEPLFAFYDDDFALATVVRRQAWPLRPGRKWSPSVRKLAVSEADRNTHLWAKVENDPEYRALAQKIWSNKFGPPEPEMKARLEAAIPKQIESAVAAVAKLKARGVDMVFVRAPSTGPYLEFEHRAFPREKTWEPLLAKTGVRGIHFEDEPTLQGFVLPEWSHLAASERPRFTEALMALLKTPPTPAPPVAQTP